MKKYSVLICLLILSVFMLAGCQQNPVKDATAAESAAGQETAESAAGREDEDNIKVHYINVGNADAILLQQGGFSMLIDAGENKNGKMVVEYIKNLGITKLDYLIGTHPHSDHIGGMDDVIYAFEIGQIIMPKVSHTTKTYEEVLIAAKDKGHKITGAKSGQTYSLGNARAEILSPVKDKYENLNEYSVVLRVTYENNSFLFTGDMEKYNEKELLQANVNLFADVLKVAHHGSSTSSTAAFLQAVNPKYGIISVGKDNDYGHPHTQILRRLTSTMTVYRTDENGTITATGDGSSITIAAER